nr:flagellar hook-basal body complex protein [Yoonia sp.]
MSFYTALTGLNGAQSDISATSNNIANVGTTGFKRSRAEFGDIFATSPLQNSSSSIGSGAILKGVKQQFTQGNIASSLNALDMAISGQGFFALKPSLTSTQVVYTRNGSFNVDNNRNVVDSSGQFLLAYPVNEDGSVTAKDIDSASPLRLPVTSGDPKATSLVDLTVNVPASAEVVTDKEKFADAYAFDPNDPESFTNSTSFTIFDDLGNPTIATVYFIKTQRATAEDPTNKFETRLVINDEIVPPDLVPAVTRSNEQIFIDRFGNQTTTVPDASYTLEQKSSPLYKLDQQRDRAPSQPAALTGQASSFNFGDEGTGEIEIITDPMQFGATYEANPDANQGAYWGRDFLLVNIDDGTRPVSIDVRAGRYNAEQLAAEVERAINEAHDDARKIEIQKGADDKISIQLFQPGASGETPVRGTPLQVDLLQPSFISIQAGLDLAESTSPNFDLDVFLAHAQIRLNAALNSEPAFVPGASDKQFAQLTGSTKISAPPTDPEVFSFDYTTRDLGVTTVTSTSGKFNVAYKSGRFTVSDLDAAIQAPVAGALTISFSGSTLGDLTVDITNAKSEIDVLDAIEDALDGPAVFGTSLKVSSTAVSAAKAAADVGAKITSVANPAAPTDAEIATQQAALASAVTTAAGAVGAKIAIVADNAAPTAAEIATEKTALASAVSTAELAISGAFTLTTPLLPTAPSPTEINAETGALKAAGDAAVIAAGDATALFYDTPNGVFAGTGLSSSPAALAYNSFVALNFVTLATTLTAAETAETGFATLTKALTDAETAESDFDALVAILNGNVRDFAITKQRHLGYTNVGNRPTVGVYDQKLGISTATDAISLDSQNNRLLIKMGLGLGASLTVDSTVILMGANEDAEALNGRSFRITAIKGDEIEIATSGMGLPETDIDIAGTDYYILAGRSSEVEAYFEGAALEVAGSATSFNNQRLVVRETDAARHAYTDAELKTDFGLNIFGTFTGNVTGSNATSTALGLDTPIAAMAWVDELNAPIKVAYDAATQSVVFNVDHTTLGPGGAISNLSAIQVSSSSNSGVNAFGLAGTSSPRVEITSATSVRGQPFVFDGASQGDGPTRFGAKVSYDREARAFTFESGTTGEAIAQDKALGVPTAQKASNIQVGRYEIDPTTKSAKIEPGAVDLASRVLAKGENDLMGVGGSKSVSFAAGKGLQSLPARAIGAPATDPLNSNPVFLNPANRETTFNVSVNGINAVIDIPGGNYIGSTLAERLQERINQMQDPVTGRTIGGVTVRYQPDDNNFVFTTGTTGSDSTIRVRGPAKLGLDDVPLGIGSVPTIANLVQATNENGVPLFVNENGDIVDSEPDNLVEGYFPLYLNEGELTFDKTGRLISPQGLTRYEAQTETFSISLDIDYSASSQLATPFVVNNLEQNGFTSGRLDGLSIDATGLLRANYTNGQNKPLGKIVMANFNNQNGLKQVGNATFVQTASSGDPIIGEAGTEGFGSIQSGSLERSNVDITEELVNLITAQRNFQAASKAIETSTQLTQTIINIRT